jgi:Tol biopolymer transport system component
VSQHKRDYGDVRLSPDATRIAAEIDSEGNVDIWMLEIERDMLTRLTFDEAVDINPVWSPDGLWIVFASRRGGGGSFNLYRRRADRTGEVERLTTGENSQFPVSFSPDGSILVFTERTPDNSSDIMLLRLGDEAEPEAFLATPFAEFNPAVSPEGRWIAYVSRESGEFEVFVSPFPRGGSPVKVSEGQGFQPKWMPDGKEIIYGYENQCMVVSVSTEGDVFSAQKPELMFETTGNFGSTFDVAPDGQRLLAVRGGDGEDERSRQPTVVVNWFEELKAKLSGGRTP